jgi:hypothetical protein
MAYGTVNADVIGTSVTGSNLGAGNASIMKNRIINGAMVISQRNGTSSVTITDTGAITYTLDRWAAYGDVASKFSIQQNAGSITPPLGFTNYLGATSLSAYSVTASNGFSIRQMIEGYNVADLGWGTANAKTVTLSFQVYSSLTGTFGGTLSNSAWNRSYPFTYTISSANTWTSISVTIAGDTSGTWLTTTGIGIRILFGLGTGSTYSGTAGAWAGATYESATGATSVVGTNGATFYITGVQLEVGSSATGFEYVNYQTSLANCQRYYQKIGGSASGYQYTAMAGGWAENSSAAIFTIALPVSMRTAPTFGTSGTTGDYQWRGYSPTTGTVTAVPNSTEIGILGGRFDCAISGLTAGSSGSLRTQTNAGFLSFSAEL